MKGNTQMSGELMNRRAVAILIFSLALCLPAAAQEDQPYQLRQLLADEYLNSILSDVASQQLSFCPFDINTACHLPRLLAQEIMVRYPELDVSYETLRTAYDRIVRLARWSDEA